VTNYVLLYGKPANEADALEKINAHLAREIPRAGGFEAVTKSGGAKALEASVLVMAANYVTPDEMIDALRSFDWPLIDQTHDCVQLAYRDQEGTHFALALIAWDLDMAGSA
jgi:hypothetical protein